MTPEQLRASILQYAIQGRLVEQKPEEGTADELLESIVKKKEELIKKKIIKKAKPLEPISEEDIPFELPSSWRWVKWGDIVNIVSARRVHQSDWKKEGVPFYRAREIAEMSRTGGVVDNELFISEELYNEFSASGVPKAGDIMVTAVGTLGKTYIVKETDRFYYKDASVICFENHYGMCSEYLSLMMQTPLMYQQIKSNSDGTTVATLTMVRMVEYLFPLPPLEEQRRIVAKIEELLPYVDSYAETYEKLEQFNAKFPEDMKKSILQYAIQGKLVEQRSEEGTAEELYQQIQAEKQKLIKEGKIKKEKPLAEIAEDEIPFDIPESWKWVRIVDTCIGFEYGTAKKSKENGKRLVLRMGNIQHGSIVYDNLVYSDDDDDIEKYNLTSGDLLFNRTNSKEWVGKTAIYLGEHPAIYAGYLVKFRPILFDSMYMNYVMQTEYYWRFCQRERTDAIGQSNINAQKLKRFVFPLPPLQEQRRIVAKIEELLPYCEQLVK